MGGSGQVVPTAGWKTVPSCSRNRHFVPLPGKKVPTPVLRGGKDPRKHWTFLMAHNLGWWHATVSHTSRGLTMRRPCSTPDSDQGAAPRHAELGGCRQRSQLHAFRLRAGAGASQRPPALVLVCSTSNVY